MTFLVFLPALWNGFVEWDDQVNLYENQKYRGLTWTQIRWMFSTVLMGHWIPLTWLTFGLDYVLWGMKPAGYHLTSLVIFAANAAAFYFVALRLLRRATGFAEGALASRRSRRRCSTRIHPLRAESVAWATERRDVLSGLFFLLTVLMYLKAQDAAKGVGAGCSLARSACTLGARLEGERHGAPGGAHPARHLPAPSPRRTLAGGSDPRRAVWLEKIPFLILGVAGAVVTYTHRT